MVDVQVLREWGRTFARVNEYLGPSQVIAELRGAPEGCITWMADIPDDHPEMDRAILEARAELEIGATLEIHNAPAGYLGGE